MYSGENLCFLNKREHSNFDCYLKHYINILMFFLTEENITAKNVGLNLGINYLPFFFLGFLKYE